AGMEALRHRAEHLAQARGLRRGEAERPGHSLRIQPEKPAGGRGRAEDARRAGDVPSAIVVLRIDGIADPALDLDADEEGGDEVPAGDATRLRHGEERGSDRPRRMDDGLEVRV